MNYFFTGCSHWNHFNIIKYHNRPFLSLEEMNQKMIDRWNEKINNGDQVFHLGDFSFGRNEYDFNKIFFKLKGKIILIKGNHESLAWQNRSKFLASYDTYKEIKINNQKIVLSHYPLLTWNCKHHGAWMLHSHCHYNLPCSRKDAKQIGKILDCGVDGNNFYPYSFDEIKEIMDKKPIFPDNPLFKDHHDGSEL